MSSEGCGMVSFVDEVTLFLRAGHGGHGCVSVRRRSSSHSAGPTAATAATVATSSSSRTRRSPRSWVPARPTARARTGSPAWATTARAPWREARAPVPRHGREGRRRRRTHRLDRTRHAIRRRPAVTAASATPRSRPRNARLPDSPCSARSVRGRRHARTEDRRRRRARRVPVGRQVEPHRRNVGREAEDRRLPVHHVAPGSASSGR